MVQTARPTQTDWNPEQPGQEVRMKANPGRRGKTTGNVRRAGTRTLVEIQFGPAEKIYKPKNLLEPCGDDESIEALLQQGRFGGPDDLRRILTFEKIKGQLTNVFYSMESSQTDFYPHQFKPVLKFLNSSVGRILIADEVGLGKTIEAMYIWKELQTREDARRLLIVCPAMLRQKWKDDLAQRFNIFAEIVDAKDLLGHTSLCVESNRNHSFACIASLEGLRPSGQWEDPNATNARAKFARLLDSTPAGDDFGLFDLAIIDEAHYLRNATTASHRIGQLIRDASKHLLLLTATPVQVDSTNLYQLLRLISPDDFFNQEIFDNMLVANQPVVNALKYLWASPPAIDKAKKAVTQALRSSYFADSYLLKHVKEALEDPVLEEVTRVELGYKLEKVSLLGQYITRSRKRDVLSNRVKRDPQTLTVAFSPLERKFYDEVTEQIREQTKGKKGVPLFRLISRQRQMASCMVAALETWRSDGTLGGLVDESLWEDVGIDAKLRKDSEEKNSGGKKPAAALSFPRVSIKELEANDSKYNKLSTFLKAELGKDKGQKFVVFAYFRGTLKYLKRRLTAEGVSTGLIMGDMGDHKWDIVNHFRMEDGPSVLLSSEVGSEGIDLQHCRFLVNYDLPWNPMRVEQRIGRLDRLNQKAERISIINFSIKDTIEEEILERLYMRIRIFEESVGDIESILGEKTEQLLIELFEKSLTPAEKRQRIEQTATALENKRLLQDELEEEAVNMLAFSDHILEAIEESKAQGRWLQPDEMRAFVEDCFTRYYPGTVIAPQLANSQTGAALFTISLSEKAKVDLQFFISQNRCATPTQLHNSSAPVSCFFDPKITGSMGKRNELLDPTHPLILWIRDRYATAAQKLHPVSAIGTSTQQSNLPSGLYVYTAYLWTFEGLKTESQIVYKVARVSDGELLSDHLSEAVVAKLMQQGKLKPNAVNFIEDRDTIVHRQQLCNAAVEEAFGKAFEEFDIENDARCNIQEKSARAFAERKQRELTARLERFRQTGKTRIIPATEGQLNKVIRELEVKLIGIQQKRDGVSFEQKQLASGVIFVE